MAFTTVLQMYLDWANSLLCEHGIVVNELKEFQDGRIFSLLIEILTDTRLFPSSEDCGDDDELSSLDRVQTILDYLTGLGIKLNVSAPGVLKGELKSILDVIWAIILHFTVHLPDTPVQQKTVRSGKKQLIQWCASQLGEASLDVGKGLAQCFQKSNKLAELIGLFCSYTNNSTETYVNNLSSALIASEEHFGITKSLLSPADVIRGTVEEHALTIYLALLRRKVTQLAWDNEQSKESSDLNTSGGLPEGLTEEVANSLSQTFSFKFMRSPSVPSAKPHPSYTSHPAPYSHVAVQSKGSYEQPLATKKSAPLPSRIPVASTRLNQSSSSQPEDIAPIPESASGRTHRATKDEQKQMVTSKEKDVKMSSEIPVASARSHQPSSSSQPQETASILESSSRKRHQDPDEQKQTSQSADKDFKMPSGIPVRKTQKMSSIKPVQTSTPISKQKQRLERDEQSIDVGEKRYDDDDGEGMHMGRIARQQLEEPGGGRLQDGPFQSKEGDARLQLDLSDIEQDDEFRKDNQGEINELDDFDMEDNNTTKQDKGKSRTHDAERVDKRNEIHIPSKIIRPLEDKKEATNIPDGESTHIAIPSRESHTHPPDIASKTDRLEEQEKGDEEVMLEQEKVNIKVSRRVCAFVREDGDGERSEDEQAARGRGEDDERKTKDQESSLEKSFTAEEVALFRRGEDLSLMIPMGISGPMGDELLSMLEAIGTEGKQLRQELNEAKEREDFLTKKLNERYSSQEEEVINRLVGELEMLRRENQRLFQELASARESGAEDRKHCENLQAAVERLEMDVERLTAENFRLKFAADTGYQVTGDDLMAAMSEAETGFQPLPSPGRDSMYAPSPDPIPSPILEAQTEHETRLLAMKAETESMRKLQELLTKAHAENRKLKAQQQHPEGHTDQEVAMAKVKAELGLAQVEGERLREEMVVLRKEVKNGRQETEEQMKRCKELEALILKFSREERESKRENIHNTGNPSTQQIQIGTDCRETSQSNDGQPEELVRKTPMEIPSDKPEAVNRFGVPSGTNYGKIAEHRPQDTRPVNEGFSISNFSQSNNNFLIDIDDNREKVPVRATVPADERVSRAYVVNNNSIESSSETSRSRDLLGLKLKTANARSDRGFGKDTEDMQKAHDKLEETPSAVDWKYLATSPSPENEMRSIAQYVARPPDIETASEVESEVESRASDLFSTSSISSPVGRLLSTHERRPSLGGLIVARAQKSPGEELAEPGPTLHEDPQHSTNLPKDSQDKDDTLIDESYLTTSPDYITADENSIQRISSLEEENTARETADPVRSTPQEEGQTPYYTPMVQRNKLQFSSLSSSLQSLRSISRKAREDIEAESPETSPKKEGTSKYIDQNVPTLEVERKWIQEELGRIRLDNNIPGEKYPDLEGKYFSTTLSSSTEDLSFMQPGFVPRWRKFRFRSRHSRTSESSSLYSNGCRTSPPSRTVSLTKLNVGDGTKDDLVRPYEAKTSPTFRSTTSSLRRSPPRISPGRRFVRETSPVRSSSDDMSDEYKPLPSELRKPRLLAERTPVKKPPKSPLLNHAENSQNVKSSPDTQPEDSVINKVPVNASLVDRNTYCTGAKGDSSECIPFTDNQVQPVSSKIGEGNSSKDWPISVGVDDISASDSVSMVGVQNSRILPVSEQPNLAQSSSSHSPGPNREPYIKTYPLQSAHTFPPQQLYDLQKFDHDKNGGSGGMVSTLNPNDLDDLAQKIILEADSGVSLTSNLDIKNGFPKNIYEHTLLSRDEQTYANSLIAKYIENSPDKF